MPPAGFTFALTIAKRGQTDGHAYLTCSTHRLLVLCVKADAFDIDLVAGSAWLNLACPLVPSTSLATVSALYDEVRPRGLHEYVAHKWKCAFNHGVDNWGTAVLSDPVEQWALGAAVAVGGGAGAGGGRGGGNAGNPKRRKTAGNKGAGRAGGVGVYRGWVR